MGNLATLVHGLEEQGFGVEEEDKEGGKTGIIAYRDVGGRMKKFRATYFSGTHHIKPWIEAELLFDVDPFSEEVQQIFDTFSEVLEPGSHLMVRYSSQDLTAKALNVGVPAPATPIGFLMWKAGFRWYKDWYISEGWKEGGQKLQANLPLNEEVREEREEEAREELEEFLGGEAEHETCRRLAENLLESI
ncbi:MAG: DUF1122 family protein [Candidatus Nanohaloarchaea archaeon]|nr:DUF1122 family protein [Candidatus Nanohaloarchaea archaeon]